MSVLVTLKFSGDTDVFRKAIVDKADQLAKIAEDARQNGGGLHHQFGIGDGYVLVIDEWETVEDFQTFFADPELQTLIGTMGADPDAPPEITVAEAIDSPDKY
ncbi:MAG TPA: hypothetical protein VE442_04990 [Jatrophihabitans sp.]|jgi:quinol monooxygenase YgiN|nr:hypothetical protein [Jatrophihabitans sp.]